MGKITVDQSQQVMAVLATNAAWGEIDFEVAGLQEAIVRDPKGAGRRFTDFLKNGGRLVAGEQKISDPELIVANRLRLIKHWQKFYHNLGAYCDFSNIVIPDDPGGFDQVVIMAKGVTPQLAYNLCAKSFPCKNGDKDLDAIVTSDRTAKDDSYAIRVCRDYELKDNKKGQQYGVTGITLEERGIYELEFFKRTGGHLHRGRILCTGSIIKGEKKVPSISLSERGDLGAYWNGDSSEHCYSEYSEQHYLDYSCQVVF